VTSFCVPAFPLEEPHDPTGAGDSFAGGFMGYPGESVAIKVTLHCAAPWSTARCWEVFTVEKFGLDRLRHLKRSEIHARGTPLREIDAIQIVSS